jgi:hypothetical protein
MITIKIKTIIMIHSTNSMMKITIKEIIKIMINTKITMANMIMTDNTITMKVIINKNIKITLINNEENFLLIYFFISFINFQNFTNYFGLEVCFF